MLGERFLLEVALAEGALATLAYALLMAHALGLRIARHRNSSRLAAARTAVAAVLQADSPTSAVPAALAGLSLRRQVRVLAELAVSLGGEQRRRLLSLASDAGLVARAQRRCASRLWWRRVHGARLLGLLGSGESVVPVLFGDRRAEVRAQAAEWAAWHPSPLVIGRLIEMLADPSNVCRFTVKDSLLRIGRPTVEPLADHLSTRSGAAAEAGLTVAVGLADPRFLGSGLRLVSDQRADARPGRRARRGLGRRPGGTGAGDAAAGPGPERSGVGRKGPRSRRALAGRTGAGRVASRSGLGRAAPGRPRPARARRAGAAAAASRSHRLRSFRPRHGPDGAGPAGHGRPADRGVSGLTAFVSTLLVYTEWAVLGYFLAVNSFYAVQLISAALEVRRHSLMSWEENRQRVLGSDLAPRISVLAPAHNEGAGVAESVRALLTLQYPNLEVVLINDGSTDETMEVLEREFELKSVHPIYQQLVSSQPVVGLYRSRVKPGLVVVDKVNGRKADALNAGLNVATGELVCAIDADTLIEPDGLLRMVRPFLLGDDVVATGGTIRVANGSTVRGGRVVATRAPRSFLAGVQAVEYMRAFLFGRLGWNRLGGNPSFRAPSASSGARP